MNPVQVILAAGFAVLAVGLACLCLEMLRLRGRLKAIDRRALAIREEQETSLAGLRRMLEKLEAQGREREPRVPFEAVPLRPGLNLSKRSQALRLHRRGDPPREIAAQLEIPAQEVELLLKVQEIVMRGL